jgi:hypothetical protein
MTAAMGDATGATATSDLVEKTAVEGVDETAAAEEAGAAAEEETSARSRPRPSQSSASLRQTSLQLSVFRQRIRLLSCANNFVMST